jgi:hypothetical protein
MESRPTEAHSDQDCSGKRGKGHAGNVATDDNLELTYAPLAVYDALWHAIFRYYRDRRLMIINLIRHRSLFYL